MASDPYGRDDDVRGDDLRPLYRGSHALDGEADTDHAAPPAADRDDGDRGATGRMPADRVQADQTYVGGGHLADQTYVGGGNQADSTYVGGGHRAADADARSRARARQARERADQAGVRGDSSADPPDDLAGAGDFGVDPPSWRRRARDKRRNMPLWQELPLLLIIAFCLAVLIRTFLVQAFYIPSGSMEETLLVGDRVLVNKILYDVREPARGEIVVFRGTDDWAPENRLDTDVGFFAQLGRTVGDLVGVSQPGEKDFIKRVVGLPGDTVACCDVQGRVTVNSYPLDESSYVTEDSPIDVEPSTRECRSRRFQPVTVEPGQLFVMGDHRVVSQDSRCQGQVPIKNVIGRAFVILWPSGRWAWLSVPTTFDNVPRPFNAAPAGRLPGNPGSAGAGSGTPGSSTPGSGTPGSGTPLGPVAVIRGPSPIRGLARRPGRDRRTAPA